MNAEPHKPIEIVVRPETMSGDFIDDPDPPLTCLAAHGEDAWGPDGVNALVEVAGVAGPRKSIDRRIGSAIVELICEDCGGAAEARLRQLSVKEVRYRIIPGALPEECPLMRLIQEARR